MKNILFLFLAICIDILTIPNVARAQSKSIVLNVPMNNASQISIEGAHRFVNIADITGLHVSSLQTKAFVETDALQADHGTISIWMSPLEKMDKSPAAELNTFFPLISDNYPPAKVDSCRFSVYYYGSGYPRVNARFTDGSFWGQMDLGLASFVYAESLPLQKGQYGPFDGNTVFEAEDNTYNNNGPVLNSGRVVLRQMYNTAMRYRNFVIYTKNIN